MSVSCKAHWDWVCIKPFPEACVEQEGRGSYLPVYHCPFAARDAMTEMGNCRQLSCAQCVLKAECAGGTTD